MKGMKLLGVFFSYIFLGLSLAAPIGPINAAQINQGIKNGFLHSWMIGLGSILGELLFIAAVYFGVVHFLETPFMRTFLWSFGAFVLFYTGIESIVSFCYYTEKAFGRWSGFSCGWNYWCSSILITGSQLIAISILTKAWFPNVPLWVFACIYSVLSVLVLLFGTKGFDRVENIFAIIKTAAIFMFIIIAIVALSGGITMKEETNVSIPSSMDQLFSNGFKGF